MQTLQTAAVSKVSRVPGVMGHDCLRLADHDGTCIEAFEWSTCRGPHARLVQAMTKASEASLHPRLAPDRPPHLHETKTSALSFGDASLPIARPL